MNQQTKPKRTAEELVKMLREEKGVTFDLMGEEEAIRYLQTKNNYLRTASYRKNYPKHRDGANAGKYIHLDFACLAELSSLDARLRGILLQMCVDIEHALKVRFLSAVEENSAENGYALVAEFLNAHSEIVREIEYKSGSVFTGELIQKYFVLQKTVDPVKKRTKNILQAVDCPVWVFAELVSFGDFLKLAEFYNEKYPASPFPMPSKNLLNSVRSLRNACAHNNCLLNRLTVENSVPPKEITEYVAAFDTASRKSRIKKLSRRPILEIVCVLKVYAETVSLGVRTRGIRQMKEFTDTKLFRNKTYFEKNDVVTSSFEFLKKVVDNWAQL